MMGNLILENKRELINWVNHLDDLDILSELIEIKNKDKSIPLDSEFTPENSNKVDFDEQFAAGMTSDELLENITAHLESISSDESSSVVSDIQSEYVVKDGFDERFAKGISSQEMRRRTIEYIRSLPWKQ